MSDYAYSKSAQRSALATAEAFCRERGLRLTPHRRAVLAMLLESPRPVKAYDLLEQMRNKDPKAKPPTVYRGLDFLMEHGLVHRLDSLKAFIGCQHPKSHQGGCYFMICEGCGAVDEYCSAKLTSALEAAGQKRAFAVRQTVLEMSGLCQACQ